MALHDHLACHFQNGQGGQAQEVKLHQTNGFHVVFVVLTHRRRAARLLVQRTKISELARRNQHTTRVHAHVAGHAFEFLGQRQQGFNFVFFVQTLGQNRLGLDGAIDGDVLPWLVGNEFADAIAEHVAHVEHTTHVTDGRASGHGAEGGNLADGIAAVFVFHVVNHAVAIGLAKVNVKVGHGDPLWIQETLKQQVVLQRIEVGNLQRIRHQRTGTRTTARPHRAAILFGPVDEVTHDQEVTWETHLQNGVDLKFQTLRISGALGLSLSRVWVQMHQALFQAFNRQQAEIVLDGHGLAIGQWRRVIGQLRLA